MKKAFSILLIMLITFSCIENKGKKVPMVSSELSLDSIRAIAKEAYIYGYPMVDGYRIQYGYFVDNTDPEYKEQWNEVHNIPRVYTPEDKNLDNNIKS